MPARVRATPSTCLTCSMIPQQLAPLRAPRQPACHGEMTWQSPEAAVSVSLPRVGEGEAGPSRPVQRVLFPPPCTADAFCTRSKIGDSKVRWSTHTESQRAGNQEERRKWSFSSLLPHPQWSWKMCSLISQLLVNSERQMISPGSSRTNVGPHHQRVLRWCEISSSCAVLLSSSPTLSISGLLIQIT